MEFRKIFDTIPEQFDKYRPRYSEELFADLISYAEIKPGKEVLELGPGTGQATEQILICLRVGIFPTCLKIKKYNM